MTRADRFTVALAQYRPVLGDVELNVSRATAMAAEAADAGAALVVFPELALTGYSLEDLTPEVARTADDAVFEPLRRASGRLAIAAGLVEEGPDCALYNAAAFWHHERLVAIHRKVYPPTYGLFDELRFLARGRTLAAFDTDLGRAGMLVCEDMWHPSTVYVLGQDGARLVLVLAASPTREVGGAEASRIGSIWYDLLRALAVLHGVFVVFVNRVGFEDGVHFWGGSVIVGPDGRERGRAPLHEPGLTVVGIDMADVLRERIRSQHVWEEDVELTLRALGAVMARRDATRAEPARGVRPAAGPVPEE
ncbi:MAG: nitrilase-related carbon-nitrogen hydrolase [Candidatus Eiseniibacteriota bacterium]|jgi:predicted amidohydrolase